MILTHHASWRHEGEAFGLRPGFTGFDLGSNDEDEDLAVAPSAASSAPPSADPVLNGGVFFFLIPRRDSKGYSHFKERRSH